VRSVELRLVRARADEVEAHLRVEHLRGRLLSGVAARARQAQSCTVGWPARDSAAWKPGLF
jgi:hypothetical protein